MEAGRVKPRAGGTLSLGAEQGGGEHPSGPLKVAFSSPEGRVGVVTELNVVFDRPVHPLGVVSDGPPPFRVTPEVPGHFHWVGSRAVVFTPVRRLPLATAFRVEVPAGLQALDGTRLEQPHRFELETRRPALVSSTPADEQRGLPLDTVLRLELDQVVAPAALQSAAKLEVVGSGVALPFSISSDPKEPRVLLVRPKRRLAPNSAVRLTLGPSLRGVEGPLEAGVAHKVTFHTYEPLALQEVSCARQREGGACEAESSVALSFNNGVRRRDLAARLHISPEVGLKGLDNADGADDFTTWVDLPGHFRAGQSYRVQIDAGLVDAFGQRSPQPIGAAFHVADHHPRVEIGAVGRNFAGQALSVPVASRNVASFELLTTALGPQEVLAFQAAWRAGASQKGLEWLSQLKGTAVQQVRPRAAKNQIDRLNVDALKVLGPGARGALAIGVRYEPDADDWVPDSVKLLNVSDLAISAKLSRFGSLAWITDRSTNQPVAGAQLELVMPQRPSHVYTTDSDGVAHIPAADFALNDAPDSPESRAILVARRGNDSVFAPVSEYLESYRLDVPTDFGGQLRPYGVLFTDRGIYRPGDEVRVKGIVRRETPTGNALPGEQAVKVSFRSPSGDELGSQSVMLSSYGTLASRFQVPVGAELGSFSVSLSGLGRDDFVRQSLEVSEYRPVELRVAASADRRTYVRGESAELEVKADYLFGAAAAGLSTTLSVSRQPTWFQVPGAEEFSTDAGAYYDDLEDVSAAGELRRETRQLDAEGRVVWREKLELPGQRGPELLRIDAEVTDISRRSVASSGSALVHPAAFYVGIKAGSDSFVEAPGVVAPEVLALDPSGRHLAGKRVSLELIERRYTYARQSSGDDAYRGVSKPVERQVARCELTTGVEPATCALAVPAAGYYVVVARAKDDATRVATAARSVYATGPGEPTWQDNDRRSLTLVLDKKSYTVGQRAKVLVKSPYQEAEALITVERSGVYHSFHRVLHGTAPSFEIPVTDELLPNAFIGVHLLPRRSGKAAALEPGSYRVGYAQLLIGAEARRLAVRVTPNKTDYRPGASIDVKLSVKDARGAAQPNTELTLYAADEGVLSLIDYRTPDPLLTFSAPRPLQVATLESRDAEGHIALEALGGRDKGRDGGGGGEGEARRDFRQTAYFNPRIITDARGEAQVTFKLPEALTAYRLMAVAVSQADRYGFAEARVTTSKPLMARPALPRLVRAGDSFEAGLIVSKKAMAAGKVRVSAAFSGLTTTAALTREVEVAENGSLEVRFAVQAPHPGQASVRFEVEGGSERDVVTQNFPISVPSAPESAAIYGQTSAAQSERLGDLTAAREDTGSLTVSLSSTALVGVDQVALDLADYPYSCSEQLASKILPLLALEGLGKGLGFSPPDGRKRGLAALGELLPRQNGDGGFGMWPGSAGSSEWVSAYVTLALSKAARAGFAVPKSALTRARDYLRQLVARQDAAPWSLPTTALALDVLGELGAPDPGGINRLFEQRGQLPLFGKALLLHAALGAKLASDVPKELRRDLERGIHLNGDRASIQDDAGDRYAVIFDSQVRTQALVLRALAALQEPRWLAELGRGLMGARKNGKFATTQEAGWALLALDDYRRVAEAEPARFEASLSLGGEPLGAARFTGKPPLSYGFARPLSALLRQGSEPLVFEKRGSGTLFYEARLSYVRRELPRQPLDAGFFIEKSLHSVRAEPPKDVTAGAPPGIASEVAAGDLVLVDLTLVVPAARRYVVIDDALPAGLEAIDPALLTTADWLRSTGRDDGAGASVYDAEPSYAPAYTRSEVRDDRVLFFVDELPQGLWHYRYFARATTLGRFVLPPSHVEEMYQPEVFGRTGATELRVR
jgi:uncharacterized protein YfaS (alpha-2-macroglobulin family)